MTDDQTASEVKACIRWYQRRGKNWLSAVEFILVKNSGALGSIIHPCNHRRAAPSTGTKEK